MRALLLVLLFGCNKPPQQQLNRSVDDQLLFAELRRERDLAQSQLTECTAKLEYMLARAKITADGAGDTAFEQYTVPPASHQQPTR